MKKTLTYFSIVFILCMSISGCASWIARPSKIILLPEERIFTVPGGQQVKVYLDHKEMEMTFPEDMKLVSPTVLVRQEEKLNNETLKGIKASKKSATTWGIIGSILGILAGVFGMFRKKIFPSIKGNIEVK